VKRGLFIIASLFIFATAWSQTDDYCLKNNYDAMLFHEFAETVRVEENLKIFYKEDWLDSVLIKQASTQCSLSEVLQNSLEKYSLNFIIDQSGNVILTGNETIVTHLPEQFFHPNIVQSYILLDDEALREDDDSKHLLSNGMPTRSITIGNPGKRIENKKVSFSGNITETETGQSVIGAVIYAEGAEVGAISDSKGYFVMTLRTGQHNISVRCVGRENQTVNLELNESGSTDIDLREEITQLRGVIVVANKGKNVTGMQIGLNKISVELIKKIPAMMGEADVLKTAILLPGVQTVGEGASGFNVRGGSTDQNLILLNSAPVFNSSHFFGFFSAFNPDVVKEFELYKSGIPAEYGGRISSVFEITSRSGNNKKFGGAGGISPVTARLHVEGPTIKEKGSFLIGARSTYSDFLLGMIKVPSLENSKTTFFDANFIVSQKINDKNSIGLSLYTSRDKFSLHSDTTYSYNNINGSLEWKHQFSDRLVNETKAIFSHYDYNVRSTGNPVNAFSTNYQINYYEGRADFRYFLSNTNTIKFGLSSVWYDLEPGNNLPLGEESLVSPMYLESEQANELSAYVSDEYNISQRLSIYGGLRFSMYNYLGPKTINQYNEGPRELYNLNSSEYEESGSLVSHIGIEPRLSLRYKVDQVSSMKLSYNRMRQNLHMLSNTTAISPTDIWKLTDPHIKPQIGDQWAIGYYRDFRSNTIETSLELYYKHINDIIEYKGGAQLILNEYIETELLNGIGQAYGLELLLEKKYGRLNGLLSYTYARTLIQVDGDYHEESINQGEYFPANYDKPHDVTAVVSYKFSRRLSVSSNITYSTGRPITYPVAKYKFNNNHYIYYSFRNEYRVPDYFRWDLSLNLEGNLKSKKLAHSSWAFSIYNMTGRDNVYSIFFTNRGGDVQGYKLSIFTQPIPTITYSFEF
jgi:hypothetical protein